MDVPRRPGHLGFGDIYLVIVLDQVSERVIPVLAATLVFWVKPGDGLVL